MLDSLSRYETIILELMEKVDGLQNTLAKIELTNLRRDMNAKQRTNEIDRLCRGEK